MAEVNTDSGKDKGGKVKRKKQTLRVDFTPMVDMNMLLITFFMFCTSLSKPQTMEINMPSKDKVEEEQQNKAPASRTYTFILGTKDDVYYYNGELTTASYEDPNFLIRTSYGEEGIRQILLEKNTAVLRQVRDLKIKYENKEITLEDFEKQAAEARAEGAKITGSSPIVIIKPAVKSNYKNVIDVLDEMQICNIGTYQLMDLSDGDKYLMYQKTGDPIFETTLAPGAK
ncbi:MAG: biopolymer transporter ExbD [Dysgonamonadaceae bacterium]|jgi:biopolymer transport protein ExbD|nr:biopolymer transporter ExbD [Dysgonamonadaceae bacterium]